jgi:hypothetical protein
MSEKPGRSVYAIKSGERIVYIGSSIDPAYRLTQLQRLDWWKRTYRMTVLAYYPSSFWGFYAEHQAIREHRPVHNIHCNPRYAKAIA